MISIGMVVLIAIICLFIGYLFCPTQKYTDRIDDLLFERDSLIKTKDSLGSGLRDLEKKIEKKTEDIQRQIGKEDIIHYPFYSFNQRNHYNPINNKIASLETKLEALEKFLNIEFVEVGTKEIKPEYKKITHPLDPSN